MEHKDNYVCSAFGYGKYGQLGAISITPSQVPNIINVDEPIFSVSAGEGHTAVLTENFHLFTFGRNAFGQLGLGHNLPIYVPTLLQSLSSKQIEAVFCGAEHTLAITADGEVYTWGLNIKGQLGLGDNLNRNSPTLVENVSSRLVPNQSCSLERGERAISAACGALHTLILTDRNKVLSCGHGNNFALGHNSQEDLNRFRQIRHLEGMGKVDKLEAGLTTSAAIIQGNLYLWGKLSAQTYQVPSQICFEVTSPSISRAKSNSPRSGNVEDVALGDNFVFCIVKGNLWGWGEGVGLRKQEPTRLEINKAVKYVSCGLKHAVGITNDYNIFVWGNGDFAQCGEVGSSNSPAYLPSYTSALASKIACGSYHTVVLSERPPSIVNQHQSRSNLEAECSQHLAEIQRLKKELEEYKKQSDSEVIRRTPQKNAYLEKDLVKIASNNKHVTPYFEVSYEELQIDPEPIGRGGYGTVYKGKWRGSTVAIKKMKMEAGHDRYKEFIQECQTMVSVRHPNIVLFMGACTISPNLCIILEYCGYGSLWDVLRNHSEPLPWYLRCKIALDTAKGVNYLHKFPTPILHRDLKSLNILLDDAQNAKIADFGWTRFKADAMTNRIGTYQWMAPEVILGQEYSEKADVYSFGIILWELATRKPPFRELNGIQVSQEVVRNDLRPPVPKRCPEAFVSLMTRCWEKQPNSRPSFDVIIEELEAFLKFLERSSV